MCETGSVSPGEKTEARIDREYSAWQVAAGVRVDYDSESANNSPLPGDSEVMQYNHAWWEGRSQLGVRGNFSGELSAEHFALSNEDHSSSPPARSGENRLPAYLRLGKQRDL